jgi:LytR cell envelope-related transcriptional attenuator
MEHAQELIRPWRRATIVVTTVAGIELVLIAGLSVALLGNPLARHLQASAKAAGEPLRRTEVAKPVVQEPTLARADVSVMVLNANGRAGAAHAAADRIRARGYVIGNVGNAPHPSPRTLIMYRPGYAAEAARLGRDLRIRTVGPLDGVRPSQLMGSHLLIILGT